MNAHSAVSQIASFLLDWAVRAAFLAAVAGLVVAVFRIRDVRTRLALWSAVLFGSLVLPAVRPFTPPLLPPLQAPVSAARTHARVHIVPRHLVRAAAAPSTTTAPRRSYLPEVALGAWAAGTLLLLARLLTGLILARRAIRTAVPVADGTRHMRGLRVLESARVSVPLTAGVLRPAVLLPQDWRGWDSERLRAVLAHERSHVERRDGLVRVAAQLHRAVLWFSPVSWWLDGHLADLAECASDDSAMAETMDRSAYAAVVLDFFRAGKKRLAIEGLAMAQGGSAERRIDRILAGGPLCGRLRRSTLIAVLALTAGSVVLVAALQNAPVAPVPPSAAAVPHVAAAPPAPAAPSSPDAPVAPAAPAAPEPAAAPEPEGNGDGWVLFHGNSSTMSGDTDDLREAQSMHDRAKQDMIWIRRDGKAWVIKDAGLLRHASELFRPVEDLSGKQEALNQEMEAFNQQQEAMEKAMEKVRGKMPRLDEDLKKLEEQLRVHEPTAEQLSELQEKLAAMQSRLEEAQEGMGARQEEINRKMEEFASKQEDLARIQEQFGKDQEKAAAQAERTLERLLNDAIRNGLAQPCDPAH
ncbi:MAG: M56 family metallopeptidase [Bryobacteraceae bacterium]|jgi:beta-lactamase regulating signal transducer with metallopeptidase domain